MINKIRSAINLEKVIISRHAKEEVENDNLSLEEIIFSVMNGEIIENYPDDFPFSSCLVFGTNQNQEPIHSVWAYNKMALLNLNMIPPPPWGMSNGDNILKTQSLL